MENKNYELSNEQVLDNAQNAGLKIEEITYGSNDYPKNLGDSCILGFENYASAREFAEKNGCEIHLFKTREGWHFWHDCGRRYNALTSDDLINDLGENYHEASLADLDLDLLIELIENVHYSESEVEKIVNNFKELKKELDNNKDDCVIVGYGGKYYDTVKRKLMSYREDVWTWEVGVLVPKDLNE